MSQMTNIISKKNQKAVVEFIFRVYWCSLGTVINYYVKLLGFVSFWWYFLFLFVCLFSRAVIFNTVLGPMGIFFVDERVLYNKKG